MLEVSPPQRSRDDLVERVRWLERELERCQIKLSNLRRNARLNQHEKWRGKGRDAKIEAETRGECESDECSNPARAVVFLEGRHRWGRNGHRWCIEHLLEWARYRNEATA